MTKVEPQLAVVVKGWPRLSETFIAQELLALERAGFSFEIWSLRHPTDKKTHALHKDVQASVHYLPEYLHLEPIRVLSGLLAASLMPGFWRALKQFARDLVRDPTRNRARRFGQACVLARELPKQTRAIYAHFLHTPSSVARYTGMIRKIPWSFSAHAKDIWTPPEWDLREKLDGATSGAAFGVTCTRAGADRLEQLASSARIDLVYHGLDLDRFPAPPNRTLRTAGDPLSLLSVGRLVEKKGFDRLIDALAQLPTDIDWHWTHIGGGDLKGELAIRAQRLNVSDRISWRGACDQKEVIEAMRASDLFILPSRIADDGDRDGLPNVFMEAASQKLPILATPVSAIPEFIDDEVHGILSRDTPEELARNIMRFEQDPQLGQALADEAFDRLQAEFRLQPGIDRLTRRLRNILRDDDPVT